MTRNIASLGKPVLAVHTMMALAAGFLVAGCKRNQLASVDSIHTGSGADARSLVPVPVRLEDQTLGFCAYVATGTTDSNELAKIGPGQVGNAQVLTPFPAPEGEFFAGLEGLDGVGGLGSGIVKSVLLWTTATGLGSGFAYLLGGFNDLVPDQFKQSRFTTPAAPLGNGSSLEFDKGKLIIERLPKDAQTELRKAMGIGVDVNLAGAALRNEEKILLSRLTPTEANFPDPDKLTLRKVRFALMRVSDPEQYAALLSAIFDGQAKDSSELHKALKSLGVEISDEALTGFRTAVGSVQKDQLDNTIKSVSAIVRRDDGPDSQVFPGCC